MPGPGASLVVPGLNTFLTSLKGQSADVSLDRLIQLIKLRQIEHPGQCAIATTHLLLRVVAESKPKTVNELLERVRQVGRKLQSSHPQELTLGNIVRRTLGLIREISEGPTKAHDLEQHSKPGGQNLSQSNGLAASLFVGLADEGRVTNFTGNSMDIPIKTVKDDTLEGLREILDELEQADEQIAGYAQDTIRRNDTILTFTGSLTVQKFLLAAAKALNVTKTKTSRFNVLIVEGFPNEFESTRDVWDHGHKKSTEVENIRVNEDDKREASLNRYKSITAAGIEVTAIPDAAVHAFMPRVDKVILPAYMLLPNGGFIGSSGIAMIARAAKQHTVPVVVVGGVYKLCPVWPFEVDSLLEWGDPSRVVSFDDGDFIDKIMVSNSLTDYVPPEFVGLYLTNLGGHAPSYMHRIATDHYRPEDYTL